MIDVDELGFALADPLFFEFNSLPRMINRAELVDEQGARSICVLYKAQPTPLAFREDFALCWINSPRDLPWEMRYNKIGHICDKHYYGPAIETPPE